MKPDLLLDVLIKNSTFTNCLAQIGGAVYLCAENQYTWVWRQAAMGRWVHRFLQLFEQGCFITLHNVKVMGNTADMANGVVHSDSISVCILDRYLNFVHFFSEAFIRGRRESEHD